MTIDTLQTILSNYFADTIVSFEKIQKGFSSDNYKIETTGGIFFLKKHRASVGKRLASIERAEQFFIANGIPIIGSIETLGGARHTMVGEDYYVLYPFVTGLHYSAGTINDSLMISLGNMLARIHLLSKNGFAQEEYVEGNYFHLPNTAQTIIEVERLLSGITEGTAYDKRAREGLLLKKTLIETNQVTLESLSLSDRHLCFGDYYSENAFFNEDGEIIYLFDLDGAGPAPRLFELIRAMMLSCFWYSVTEEKIVAAKKFISTYYNNYPFKKEQLQDALELYYVKSFHETWMENNHYQKNDYRSDSMYGISIDEIKYLTENRDRLFEEITKDLK